MRENIIEVVSSVNKNNKKQGVNHEYTDRLRRICLGKKRKGYRNMIGSKILTIVVPSYNTEKYMDECLPSFLDERILDDLEVLLINDGSKDRTEEVAKKYQEQYPNTIRLINKENGGHGSVINRGIKEARGRYFKVIDGDDWVITENLVKLVQELKLINVDLVLNPYQIYHIVRKKYHTVNLPEDCIGQVKSFDEVANKLGRMQLHMITYNTELIRQSGVRVRENCYYEDAEYGLFYIPYIQDVAILEDAVYVYRIGSSEQSVNVKNLIRNENMALLIRDDIINFYQRLPNEITEEKRKYIIRYIKSVINSNYSRYLKMNFGNAARKRLYDYDDDFKEKSKELYENTSSLAIKLIRTKTWVSYAVAHVAFRMKIRVRGY